MRAPWGSLGGGISFRIGSRGVPFYTELNLPPPTLSHLLLASLPPTPPLPSTLSHLLLVEAVARENGAVKGALAAGVLVGSGGRAA